MTDGEGLHDNSTTSTVVSYSELLFSGAADDDNIIDHHLGFSFTSSPADSPPKMLCFGDSVDIYGLQYHKNAIKMVQKTDVLTCINPPSSKKRNAEGKATFSEDGDIIKKSEDGNGAPEVGNKKNSKKSKSANNSLQNQVNRHAKVKKVKLGERILALQQLVSPFGKTDTASVLHEAKGYISFLQDQVQLLCSPYLQLIHQEGGERVRNEEEVKSRKDLRSKGLCLVPIGITSLHVTDDNGADYWSPANALVNPSS